MFLSLGLFVCIQGYSAGQDGFKKTSTGLIYQVYKVGKDTLLFDSKTQMKGEPVRFELPPSDFKGDLYEAIRMLSPGDSGTFIINSDSLFLKTFRMPKRPAMIDSNSAICFYVHLLSINNPAKMKADEEIALQKYLSDNKITVPPTASGIYIVESKAGEGIKIDTGCMVKLQFIITMINGKQVFSSYERPEPLKFQYGQKFDTPGIQEAIAMMKQGEKAKVIIPSKMALGDKGRSSVPPYSTLIYDVEILDVVSKADYEKELAAEKLKKEEKGRAAKQDETVLLDKYLKDNNITVKPTASGLYFIEKTKGTGAQAMAGKIVKVHYRGTLLNGTKFDSSFDRNEPYEFTLGTGRVIAGWDEGIAMMKQGGKAMLIIPSSIAYGEVDKGQIPPYSTLVFDVELVEVK